MDKLSEYRIMWVLVFFDLPTETKKDKRAYALFRKQLQMDGFTMFSVLHLRSPLCKYGECGSSCQTREKLYAGVRPCCSHVYYRQAV